MRPALAGLAVCACLAAGCASEEPADGRVRFDRPGVESTLRAQVPFGFPGHALGAVRCPDAFPPAEPGASVVCTVELSGVAVRYAVVVTGDQRFVARPEAPVVDARRSAEAVRMAVRTEPSPPTELQVSCGDARVVQLAVGATMPCTAVDDGRTRPFLVRVVDEEGTVVAEEQRLP